MWKTNFDFIGKRYIAYLLSLSLIVGSWAIGIHRGIRFGIDFTGGVSTRVAFANPKLTSQNIRNKLSHFVSGISVQSIGNKGEFLVKVPVKTNPNGVVKKLKLGLETAFPNSFKVRKVDVIGPRVGSELKRKGILALFYALIGILIYVSIRFQFIFAFAAVAALFHDALSASGVFTALGREFSLPVVAALLTVIGYSVNDTIVVFDRIRENMRIYRNKKPFAELVNKSINETLSRTIITSLTTFFVVLCLFLFGGSSINNFSFIMLMGIIVGTYSSIFIASAIVVDWYKFVKKVK